MIGPKDLAPVHQQNSVGPPWSQPAAPSAWLCSDVLLGLLTKLLQVRPNGNLSGVSLDMTRNSMKAEVELAQPLALHPLAAGVACTSSEGSLGLDFICGG